MKTAIAVLTLGFASFTAADCSDIEFVPAIPDGQVASEAEMREARDNVVDYVDRRKAYMNCMRPAPFVQEKIVVEMESLADEFNREREAFLERNDAVAVN